MGEIGYEDRKSIKIEWVRGNIIAKRLDMQRMPIIDWLNWLVGQQVYIRQTWMQHHQILYELFLIAGKYDLLSPQI